MATSSPARQPGDVQPGVPLPRHVLQELDRPPGWPRRLQGDPRPQQAGLPAHRRAGAGEWSGLEWAADSTCYRH